MLAVGLETLLNRGTPALTVGDYISQMNVGIRMMAEANYRKMKAVALDAEIERAFVGYEVLHEHLRALAYE